MSVSLPKKSYIDIDELVVLTGLSRATLWRFKRAGKIAYFQPSGKGGRVTFPKDAIERAMATATVDEKLAEEERLPGRKPVWQQQKP